LRGSRYAYTYTSTSTYIHVCIHLSLHIYTCIHICISHMYINIHKHMYITRVYLHTYTYVYQTPTTPTTRIRVAQPSAASLLRSFECRAAFSTRGGTYRHSQEDMHWLSLVWKGVLGAEVCMCTCAGVYMCRCVGIQLTASVPTTYTPSRLSKRLRHAGVCIDTHSNTSIGSRSLARVYVY
jgi:hypothetical protein